MQNKGITATYMQNLEVQKQNNGGGLGDGLKRWWAVMGLGGGMQQDLAVGVVELRAMFTT